MCLTYSDVAIARNDPCRFHINLRIAVARKRQDERKVAYAIAISLTRQFDQKRELNWEFEDVMSRAKNLREINRALVDKREREYLKRAII